jgi:hypothetical protein
MLLYPDSLDLDMRLQGNSLSELCQLCLPKLVEVGLPPIKEWEIPMNTSRQSQGLEQKLEELRANTDDKDAPVTSHFILGDDIALYIDRRREQASVWNCSLNLFVKNHHTSEDLQSFLNSAVDFCKQLLRQTQVYNAVLRRQGGGGDFIPTVPVANKKTHLVLTTNSEVEQSYDQAEVFWKAGWSSIEEYGAKYLLLRGMNAIENLSFLSEVLPHQWDMARTAKPGLIKYYRPNPQPEEMEIFNAGEPRLNRVGYVKTEQLVEYTCYVEPDEHIQGWEIYKIRDLIKAGSLEDGRKVDGVRIVFPNCEMAEREKRPLLDVGAKVFYLNTSGEDVEITE